MSYTNLRRIESDRQNAVDELKELLTHLKAPVLPMGIDDLGLSARGFALEPAGDAEALFRALPTEMLLSDRPALKQALVAQRKERGGYVFLIRNPRQEVIGLVTTDIFFRNPTYLLARLYRQRGCLADVQQLLGPVLGRAASLVAELYTLSL